MYFFFFFPVGTDTRTVVRPVGTFLLLTVLLGAFSLRFVRPDLYNALILTSFRPSDPGFMSAFLSLFLHAGWMHLVGNALYLWIFGRQFEGRLGFVPLAVVYVAGGVSSCWVQAWLTPAESRFYDIPLIGASGAVAAILGATVVRFHHQRVRILWALFAFLGGMTKGGVTYLNTVVACVLWFVFQVIHGFVAWGGGGAPVAYAAHAGGFVTGLLLAFVLQLHRGPPREIHFERGRRYFEKNDWYAAAGELTSHLQIVPEDTDARRMRARCLVLLGSPGEAAGEYLRLFREARQTKDVPAAASLYREMRVYGVGSTLTEQGLLRLAFDFQKAGRISEAAEVYLEIVTRLPEGEIADLAAIRRAELLWSELGRYDEARDCYRALLERTRPSEWRSLARARLRSMSALAGGTPPTSRARDTWSVRARSSARRKS